MSFLLGVPAKLKTLQDGMTTLLTRLSSIKSGYLDATISSRAPASTALSTAQWTAPRAALLDKLSGVDTISQNAALAPPISTGTISGSTFGMHAALLEASGLINCNPGLMAAATWTPMLNVAGKGVISFLAIAASANVGNMGIRVIVDGVTYYTSASLCGGGAGAGCAVIGAAAVTAGGTLNGLSFEPISFNTSLVVDGICASGAGPFTVIGRAKWRKSS
jgi:hypothetical protein